MKNSPCMGPSIPIAITTLIRDTLLLPKKTLDMTIARFILIALLLLQPLVVFGEQSTDSTGDYFMDLGQVYGAIKGVGFMKDICGEAFPDYVTANETAYRTWRARYQPFLQEIERHHANVNVA